MRCRRAPDPGVADVAKDRKARISTQGTREPRSASIQKGGNRELSCRATGLVPGDQIKKPPQGEGGRGKEASTSVRARTI
jgi:hypothetical protein